MLAEAGITYCRRHNNRCKAFSYRVPGVPWAALAKCPGHSTMQITMRYAHLMLGADVAADSVVDAFLEHTLKSEGQTGTGSFDGSPQNRKWL